MRKVLIASVFFVVVFLLGSADSSAYTSGRYTSSGNIPQPRLIEPVKDKVDIHGLNQLVFRWSPHEGSISQRRFYDFRLYKGYQTLQANLLIQEKVSPHKNRFIVDTDIFELGQVYTWSLRQNYRVGKSRRSTSSFTVISR
jgi:hypothetical protein